MERLTISAKNLEEVLKIAEEKLKINIDKIQYELIQEAKKGFFGFASKECIIEIKNVEVEQKKSEIKDNVELETEKKEIVKVSDDVVQYIISFLNNTLRDMNLDCNAVIVEVKNKFIEINFEGKDSYKVIGHNGKNLEALQHLTGIIASKENAGIVKIKLNAHNYREKREKELISLANRMAKKSLQNKEDIKLQAMNAYERRIIHSALHNRKDIVTSSEGAEPYRYVVIKNA